MDIKFKKIIFKIVSFVVVILIIYNFPSLFEGIYNCGKDFGTNITNLIIKLLNH